MGRLWREYERVIKDNGAIVLTANAKFTFLLGASNIKLLRYKWVWMKTRKTMFIQANKMPLRQHEDVLIFYKSLPTYNPQMTRGKPYIQKRSIKDNTSNQIGNPNLHRKTTVNNGEYFPSDIIEIEHDIGFHPTQKPVALFEYLIRTYTNENELVLDNCSGSGTTAVACMNTNRRFICIERDETYHKKSLERLANHEPLLHMGDKC
jgi:site-specific DNA-methyltransferase (adenine-specific)